MDPVSLFNHASPLQIDPISMGCWERGSSTFHSTVIILPLRTPFLGYIDFMIDWNQGSHDITPQKSTD